MRLFSLLVLIFVEFSLRTCEEDDVLRNKKKHREGSHGATHGSDPTNSRCELAKIQIYQLFDQFSVRFRTGRPSKKALPHVFRIPSELSFANLRKRRSNDPWFAFATVRVFIYIPVRVDLICSDPMDSVCRIIVAVQLTNEQ